MSPDRRTVLRAAGAATVLGLGAACARIPTTSPIDSRPLAGRAQPGAPYVQALPPPEDATAEQVVSGFVQAGVGSEENFGVARSYLTEELSGAWNPTAGITIYSSSQELQVKDAGTSEMVLVLQVLALVDGGGTRSLLSGPVARDVELTMAQVDGQWRISAVPDGIFLSEAAFETLYSPARLYFLDARTRHLVPDHRWFSLQRGASAVLEALADGPAAFLRRAVHNEVPDVLGVLDAEVTSGADGTPEVTVPEAILDLAAQPRAAALAQLESSLRSMRTLSGIRLVRDGQEYAPEDEDAIERALPGHRAIAAGPTGVILLADPTTDAPADQLVPDLADLPLTSPVIAQDGVLAAALVDGASKVLIASTDGSVPLREAATGGLFVPPRIDDAGYVWTSTVRSAGVLLALAGRGPADDAKVDAPWLVGREVRALDIAADATRMLVLSADAAGTRLDLCAVVRDEHGAPTSLTEPVQVRTFLSEETQASWYDETAVIMLGSDPGTDELRGQLVDFEAGREPLPALRADTDRIAGTVIGETIWIGAADGSLQRSDGSGWVTVDLDAHDPWFY
ncbi:MAG: LpqB family beta-propeller domain-containing protein [Brachybacterium tyrofermentans]|uniref:LpqB family beta-propeller domain-containing protein n=1 Tax=Brachybacterium tyrofermentans TaxID=47848 RepID=A0ABW0F9N6_9MICO|nr:LpqB family beta-propeller domain-containing protein [Brachybacterium tyrofermentans]SLN02571.1 LpqB [Corynebacterium xerosis]